MFLCLLLLLLVCRTQTDQFLGTVMSYYPANTNVDGSVTVNLHYKLNFQNCTNLSWECLSGNCGNESLVVRNVYEESNGEWCQTEGISTRRVPTNAPFQLWLNGSSWINNITNGIVNYRAVTQVELRSRSDTGKANASPQTTMLPSVRVPSNCQRDFNLLAFDPDGDTVKCRYGNAAQSECDPCTPPSVLSLSPSCTLSFSPTSSSNEGPYAVQLVMEDFPTQTITLTQSDGAQTTLTPSDAISKIPVQFVLWVDPAAPSCTEGLYLPVFVPPTPNNRAQLFTPVNNLIQINIQAEANNSTISELLYSGPSDLIHTTLGAGQFSLTWTPSQTDDGGSFPICFVVKAHYNLTSYYSDQRCVTVTVRNNPTTTTTALTATTTAASTFTSSPLNTPHTTSTTTASSVIPDTSTHVATAVPTTSPTTFTTSTDLTTSPTTFTTSTDLTTSPTTFTTSTDPTTSPATVTTSTDLTTSPAPFTSSPPSSAMYVVGLRAKVTSTHLLSDAEVQSYLQQVKSFMIMNFGLPDFTVNLVSIVQK